MVVKGDEEFAGSMSQPVLWGQHFGCCPLGHNGWLGGGIA